jgi:hypothetical protein
VLPRSERSFDLAIVPIGACGEVEVPRLRAFQLAAVSALHPRGSDDGESKAGGGGPRGESRSDEDNEGESTSAAGEKYDDDESRRRQVAPHPLGSGRRPATDMRELDLVVIDTSGRARIGGPSNDDSDQFEPVTARSLTIFVVP